MRKLILPFLLLHFAFAVNAATYYFSTSLGDDSRTSAQAQSSSTPWQTIGKLNAVMSTLKPGDQVLFKKGETFTGGLIITVSGASGVPITFGAWGNGNKPIITGFTTLTGWTQARTNVWEANLTVASGNEAMVTMSGQQQAIGRYPNKDASNGGYLTINSHVGLTQLTSSQLPASPNWTGADIAIRKNRWVIDRSSVTYHSGTTIGFVSGSDNPITDKYGFFVENHTNTLDQNGEWFYDKIRNKLQMYFTSTKPNTIAVKASIVETLVAVNFANYLTFRNIAFTGANSYGFNLINSSYITIDSCALNFSGINAVQGLSSNYVTVSNSNVNWANNNGINLYWNCSNATIKNNVIKNTANIAGMSQNSTGTFQGISVRGDNNLIQYNEVDSTGANAIHFEGDYSTVQNNFVNVFGFVVDDCGGIYTGQGNGTITTYNSKSILNNIVLNGIGAVAGTDDSTYIATQGIYLDANTNHIAVSGNTVANCGQAGIFNNNTTFSNITNNTMFNNGKEQLLAVRQQNPVSNVTITGNIMFSRTATQLSTRIETYSGTNNLAGLGTINNNYYCRPIDNNYIFYDLYTLNNVFYTSYENLSSWQSKFGFDANSQGAPALIPTFTSSNLGGVDKYSNGSYNSSVGDVGSFASTGDISKIWVPNKLDAGTMQVTSNTYSSNNNYMLTLPLNAGITAGKTYLLTFSLQGGASNAPMSVYLRQLSSPNIDLTTRTSIPISVNRQEISLGLTATTTAATAAVELDVAAPNGAVWVDNVTLQDATITPTNPDDYIIFQYNASTTPMTVHVNGPYYDAKGATYTGNFTLQPYTSVVLFQKQGTTQSAFKTTTDAPQSISLQGNLVSASPASVVSSNSASVNWQVGNQSSTASYYGVERSADAVNYTTIGKTSTKTTNDVLPVNYSFTDASPAAGKNYYRITQYDEKGVPAISKIVMVNNISFKINPNPARDVIHLVFDQVVNAEDHLGKDIVIRSMSGTTVKAVQLPSVTNLNKADINVSTLKTGMYILSITSDGKAVSKSFLKQ